MPQTNCTYLFVSAPLIRYTILALYKFICMYVQYVIAIMFYLSAVVMFLNDLLVIGPSLVYNFC